LRYSRELGESYAVNDQKQFHLDSVPAVLTDMLGVLECVIGPSAEAGQDPEVLDQLFSYIDLFHQGQFLNNDKIMLTIFDVMALTNRFVSEKQVAVWDVRKQKETWVTLLSMFEEE